MTTDIKRLDGFDRTYCDRMREAVWNAIVEASRDSGTQVASLRNYEIYDALLQVHAMLLASSKETDSPTKARQTSHEFAKRLRQLIAQFRYKYESEGVPFDVVHTDELH